jgi:hypothetical protein
VYERVLHFDGDEQRGPYQPQQIAATWEARATHRRTLNISMTRIKSGVLSLIW